MPPFFAFKWCEKMFLLWVELISSALSRCVYMLVPKLTDFVSGTLLRIFPLSIRFSPVEARFLLSGN